MTSHDVVARLRRILHTTKIGHSGTLDPNATGVLLVLIGKACKALPFLEDTDKEYIATLQLGIQTISDDIWMEPLKKAPIQPITDFQSVLNSFRGVQKQVPPMISSVRVNGRKLYEYAREGIAVTRPEREVTIYDIEALDSQKLQFRVSCSSGTYVRSLCHDIAQKTGNLGCMSSLCLLYTSPHPLTQHPKTLVFQKRLPAAAPDSTPLSFEPSVSKSLR